MERQPCVYLLASHCNGTLFVGVTSNLIKRVDEHRNGLVDSFTKRFAVHMARIDAPSLDSGFRQSLPE